MGPNSRTLELSNSRTLEFQVHNVAIDEKKFRSVEQRLNRVLDQLRDEMLHATQGSLGGFGKLEQNGVAVILDLSEMDEANAGSYRRAIQMLVTQQLQYTEGRWSTGHACMGVCVWRV